MLDAHARIAELADKSAAAEELLGALIDLVAGAGTVLAVFGNDPSVVAALSQREADYQLRDKDSRIVAAIAGARPTTATRIRAHAAIAVAKDGTRVILADRDRGLSKTERAELLAAALRALNGQGGSR